MHPPRVHSAPSLLSCLFTLRPPPPFITFLAFFMAQVKRELQRKPRFYRSRSARLRRASSVSFFEWRVIQFPCEGWISGAADDIILHAGRSDIKSHLRESPLPVTYLTFRRVYNGFLSRGIVQVTRALQRR